jgi:Bacterial Ig-like domain (group 3)/FG-GAP-like repeat
MTQFDSAAILNSDTQFSATSLRRYASDNTAQSLGLLKRLKSHLGAFAFIAILCAFSSVAHATQPNTSATTLAVAPGNSVTAGTAVTLTASVAGNSSGGPLAITHGTVLFCDANAPNCEDSALLATIQVTNAGGTATAHLTLGVGTYSIKAVFQGSDVVPQSSSLPQTVTVTGNASYSSFSVIAKTGTAGNYTLLGGVAAFGRTPPSGTISFLDTTNGNAVLGTPTLNPATLGFFLIGSTQPPTGTGQQPGTAVLADVNNDGRLDLILAVNETNTISVQLGLGDGTFQAPIFSAGTIVNPSTIVVGDFNGDGNLDMAMGNLGDTTITVLLGIGDGTFQAPQTYPVGSGPVSIAVGDFNGDGNLDLAVLNTNDNNVTILLGQGDGTFQTEADCSILPFVQGRSNAFVQGRPNPQMQCPPMTLAVGSGASQIATADLNGDGSADLVVTNADDATVSVLLGAGDGTFQTQAVYAVNFGVGGIAIADFNGDGFPDLVAVYSEGNTASVLLGNGDGTFQPTVNYAVGNFSGHVVASDFNGDGKMDVAVSNVIDGTISLLLGKGDGTFQPQVTYPAGSSSSGMAAGDLNGDGLPDLIIANRGGNNDGEWFAAVFLSAQTEIATSTGVSVFGTGTHSVQASYPGDTDRAASTSDPISLTAVPQTTTTTTLSLSPSTVAAGHVVSLTATIAPVPTGADMGTMSFFRGAALLATALVNSSGIGTLNTSNFPPGASASITAVYSGNAAFAGSTSAPQTLTVNPRIVPAITLVAAPNPSTVGTLVIITATISPVPGFAPSVARVPAAHTATLSPVPNGEVASLAFFSGTTRLGFGAMNSSGVATFNTSTLPIGSSNITAVFSGNASYANSTSAILVVVVTPLPVSTTTTLNAITSPGTVGQPITFTAAVSPTPSGTPTGTVSFFNGGTLVGTGTVNSSGIATFTTSSLAEGTMSINAVFSGNALFLGSESAPQTVVINPDYAVTAPAAPQTLAHGGSVNFTIGVPPVGNSYNSVVTMSASGLPAGATATFNPSTVTPGIAGATTVMTVTLAATAITVAKLAPGPVRNHPFAPFAFVVAGLCFCFGKRKQLGRSLVTVLAFAVVLGGTLAATGCGGGFGNPGASAQTVVVTVTGTSGSVQHSTHVTLILK